MKKTILISLLSFIGLSLSAQNLVSFKNEKGKWGYKNSSGAVVIPPKYKFAWDFYEGRARVKNKKDKYGFIDSTGNVVIPLMYENAYSFKSGIASVKLNGKYGFIDAAGKVIIDLKYDETGDFSEGLIAVRLGSTIDPKYGTLKGGKWGFIDKSGKEVIPLKYDRAGSFTEGLACVEYNDKYGFIDKAGKEVIPFRFDDANDFSEGLARVRRGGYFEGKYGYIDKTGEVVIPIQYEEAGDFYKGEAKVKLNGKSFYIDKTGSNEEIRKQKAAEEAERFKKERKEMIDRAIALAKRDTLAREVLNLYLAEDQKLFLDIVDLQRTVESSMQIDPKYGFNKNNWRVQSTLIDSKVTQVREHINSYKNLLKQYEHTKGKNELYDRISDNLERANAFVSSCSAWADYIETLGAYDDGKTDLDRVAGSLTSLKNSDDALRAFIALYKKRNSL